MEWIMLKLAKSFFAVAICEATIILKHTLLARVVSNMIIGRDRNLIFLF